MVFPEALNFLYGFAFKMTLFPLTPETCTERREVLSKGAVHGSTCSPRTGHYGQLERKSVLSPHPEPHRFGENPPSGIGDLDERQIRASAGKPAILVLASPPKPQRPIKRTKCRR
jgi:hypothetical protein